MFTEVNCFSKNCDFMLQVGIFEVVLEVGTV
jgi:hypothetical protein